MNILGIETSCDETAAAVVRDGTTILSNIIASQVDIHSRYGGVVPEVASRQHLLTIVPIVKKALYESGLQWSDLNAVAVTNGPGLAGSLIVGVNIAKAIALARDLPLIGVNHLEAHIYANWLEGNIPHFPTVCLIVSGGHTDLILMTHHGKYRNLGRTRDDAAGEAFDKVARILGLDYPGGPAVERAALQAGATPPTLPRAWLKGSDDFSFSGLKTAVLHLVQERSDIPPADVAASFQESVVDVLVTKTVGAAMRMGAQNIMLCGGVASNQLLRRTMQQRSPLPIFIPSPTLCTDNAAMTACCAFFRLQQGTASRWDMDVIPNLKLPQEGIQHNPDISSAACRDE